MAEVEAELGEELLGDADEVWLLGSLGWATFMLGMVPLFRGGSAIRVVWAVRVARRKCGWMGTPTIRETLRSIMRFCIQSSLVWPEVVVGGVQVVEVIEVKF